jgi:HSP20 family protein
MMAADRNIFTSAKELFTSKVNASIHLHAPYDIYEHGAVLTLEMVLPNIDTESLEILCGKHDVTVEGIWKRGGSGTKAERQILFQQTIQLPLKIKKEEAFAQYDKGILVITLPKAE